MKIRTRLVLSFGLILLAGLLLIAGWAYHEVVLEHPRKLRMQAESPLDPQREFAEIILYGGVPALVIALLGGWVLMSRALAPIRGLTGAIESIREENLGQQLPRSGNGDELDRLADGFNAMSVRLAQSFARAREFAVNASHELKTPLTIMRGEIEMRLSDPALPSPDREFLASQLDEILRLAKIVDGLTLLAKAESKDAGIGRDLVRLDELVQDCFEDTQILAQPAGIEVALKACERVRIRGDRHRLRQLLLNLADNAIKYNEPGGQVHLSLQLGQGVAELRVANTGPGVPAAQQPYVFDPFFRGELARHRQVEGSGLGLSIAQWIVKAHGGAIELSSTPKEWTTVTVWLPLMADPGA